MVRSGFTLVEVMVALIILAAGVMAGLGVAAAGVTALRRAQLRQGAAALAEATGDSLLQATWDGRPAMTGWRTEGPYRVDWVRDSATDSWTVRVAYREGGAAHAPADSQSVAFEWRVPRLVPLNREAP
jgi:prepilin-type N-terminal cleavage/methylation domain-containing protein